MITTEQVKELRDQTGVSIMQCKKALEEAGGDKQKALVILSKKSGDIAAKKSDRTLGAGVVQSYIHGTNNVGALVELSCETDFVAKNADFIKLAYEIALHITAAKPEFLKKEDVPADAIKTATEVFTAEVKDKPENMRAKILQNKLDTYFGEKTLLEQAYVKNPEVTIGKMIEMAVQKFGEKTEIRRFARFSVTERSS